MAATNQNASPKYEEKRRNFHKLQSDVAVLDGRLLRRRVPLGVDDLDSALAGGLALGRVHMLCANWGGNIGAHGALTGFAICLLRQLLAQPDQDGPIVWCPSSSMAGSGMLYGAGLAALGLDPGRLLIVDAPSPNRRLAVLEDILRTKGLSAVVVEYDSMRKSSDYWMRLARRAQLAAEASGTTGFLLGWPVAASGFETIWKIKPAIDEPAIGDAHNMNMRASMTLMPWRPTWDVELAHARGGRAYETRLIWDVHTNIISNNTNNTMHESQPDLAIDTPIDRHSNQPITPDHPVYYMHDGLRVDGERRRNAG